MTPTSTRSGSSTRLPRWIVFLAGAVAVFAIVALAALLPSTMFKADLNGTTGQALPVTIPLADREGKTSLLTLIARIPSVPAGITGVTASAPGTGLRISDEGFDATTRNYFVTIEPASGFTPVPTAANSFEFVRLTFTGALTSQATFPLEIDFNDGVSAAKSTQNVVLAGAGGGGGGATCTATPSLALSPPTVTVAAGATQTFSVTAANVNWTATSSTGTISGGSGKGSASFTFTAPAAAGTSTITLAGTATDASCTAPQSRTATVTVTVSTTPPTSVVADPTFTPKPGTYAPYQTVALGSATQDAVIRYTTDRSTPTASSPVYENQIVLQETTTIRAIATASGKTSSGVVEGTFVITPPTTCISGQTQCSGARVQTCSSDGTWSDAVRCPSDSTCSVNECVAVTGTTSAGTCPAGAEATAFNTWLSQNNLTASDIPHGCDASGNLTHLAAAPDKPIGTLFPIAQFTHLTNVNFQSNGMAGTLPASLASYPLELFWIAGSKLTGSVPQLPPTLKSLHLGGNQLTGPIPALPAGLQEIHLFTNQLTGPIPALSGLASLVDVNLEGNALTGPIPTLPTGGALRSFQVGYNRLTGSVPLLPAGLQRLLAQNNLLDGTIVAPLPATLTFLWIPSNALTGTVPPMSATALTVAHISGNKLTGALPSLPATIREFYAFDNQLTGTIPSLASFTALTQYSVAINKLTGTPPALPPTIVGFNATNNQLVGPIPQPFPASIAVYAVYANKICPPYPYPPSNVSGTFALEPQDVTGCTTEDPSQTLTPSPASIPADGTSISTLTAQLVGYPPLTGKPAGDLSGYTVAFSATANSAGTLLTDSAVTDATGKATARVRAPLAAGTGSFTSREATRDTTATAQVLFTGAKDTTFTVALTVPLEARSIQSGGPHGTHATSTLSVGISGPGITTPILRANQTTNDAGQLQFELPDITVADGTKLRVSLKTAQHLRRTVEGTVQKGNLVLHLGDRNTFAELPDSPLKGKYFLPAGDVEGTGGVLHDNLVSNFDLTAWITAFRQTDAASLVADLDGNGSIGAEDLSLIVRNYNVQGDGA